MISEQKYIEYITKEEPLCFLCEKDMGQQEQRVYQIKTCVVANFMPRSRNKILTFHEDCFKSVAGETFMIEGLADETL